MITKNSSRFAALVEAITADIISNEYLYSGIYTDKLVEIGADVAAGVGRLTRNVEQIIRERILALPANVQVFIWSECFATRSEKDELLKQLSGYLAAGGKFDLFAEENIASMLCGAFIEAVLEKASFAYNKYQHEQ